MTSLFKLCGKRQKRRPEDPEYGKELCAGDGVLRKQRSELLELVQFAAASTLGCQRSEIDVETVLATLGLDSAAALRFVDVLEKQLELGSRRLPASLVFDYPSVAELVDRGLPRFLNVSALREPPFQVAAAVVASTASWAPVLISSQAFALPGADDLQVLWTRLEGLMDEVQEIPLCRWDWAESGDQRIRHGSFLENAEQFDAEFFSLSAAETQVMDPQQRLLLTTSFRALSGSGHDKATLQGTPMSIFVALSNQDWYQRSMSTTTSAYTGTGVSTAVAANRISFTLGLRGASAAIDTACSSSLTAISMASDSLQRPSRHQGRKLRESVAAGCELLLGPNSILLRSVASMLSPTGRCQTFNATADGYVRGEGCGAILLTSGDGTSWFGSEVMLCATATNQDGRSATLTAPNGQAQEDVLLDALWMASLPCSAVTCVECHGTGTALGDPIEASALRAVFGQGTQELWLGAGKTHLGHLEAAAGFAGLAKVMCSLKHSAMAMAPNLHFNTLNPHIDLGRLAVPTAVSPLQEGQDGLISGLSSFGFGGTNAHALLRAQPATLSQVDAPDTRKVAMLFGGQGEIRWPGQCKELYAADANFRGEMDRCANLSSKYLERPGLLDVLLSDSSSNAELLSSSALYSFVASFSLQYAMVGMWKARGVHPVAVLGHSLGDFVAATVAGVLTLEDGLRLVATRGRLLDQRCQHPVGGMAAIFAPLKEVEATLVKYKDLNVAAINSPSQTVVSGPKVDLEDFCQQFSGKSKFLGSRYAMHSKLVSPVLQGMQEELKTCKFAEPAITFVSCMTSSAVKQEVTATEYWLSHDQAKPVNFLGAVKVLEALDCTHFLEVGPTPVLAKLARTFSQVPADRWLTSIEPDRPSTEMLLSALRAMQVVAQGTSNLYRPRSVPWVKPLLHPLLGTRSQTDAVYSKNLQGLEPHCWPPALRLFQQHRVRDAAVLPAASHLLLMAAAQMEETRPRLEQEQFVELKDVSFEQILPCEDLQIEVHLAEEIQLRSRGSVHARAKHAGVVGGPGARGALLQQSVVEWKARCNMTPSQDAAQSYRTLAECQLHYGPSFASILSWSFSDRFAIARLGLKESESWEKSLQLPHPGILDGAFQLMVLAHSEIFGGQHCLLPFTVDTCVVATQAPTGETWATLLVTNSSASIITGDVEISCDGLLLARLTAITLRSTAAAIDGEVKPVSSVEITYDLTWEPAGELAAEQKRPKVLLCPAAVRHDLQALLGQFQAERCEVSEVPERLGASLVDLVVYLASGDALDCLAEALALLQAIQRCSDRCGGVLLLTEGTQRPELEMTNFQPQHAGLWGLARSARLECDFPVQVVDLPADPAGAKLSLVTGQEEEVCFRSNGPLVPRLKHSEIKPAWPVQLRLSRGSMSGLTVEPQAKNNLDGPLLRVAAIGLNFRDVLNVVGLYPGDPGEPGLDCSGIVADERSPFALGEDVFGIAFGCFRSYVPIKEPRWLSRLPPRWCHVDAAALPTVFTTVEVALNDLARLKAGQRLLVHAGAGGVGLSAVQYALRLGALVYATAGREEKKQHLLQMGVQFVASSRDGALFEEELAQHLQGEKMDVVLNSLSHDDFIRRSAGFLREGGAFIEIGKRGIWTEQEMSQHRPDLNYKVLAMDTLCEEEPDRFNELLGRLSQRMETDWVPLPREVFEGLEHCADALQVLRKAQKIGKIVVSLPPLVAPGAGAHVLTGGTGALGLAVGRRLLEEGAKDLVLISRSGQTKDLGQLQKSAAQIRVRQCDLASPSASETLAELAEHGPIRAVLHLAGQLRDGLLEAQRREDLQLCWGAKVHGLQAMRQALEKCEQWEKLDFILSFSSTAAIFGAAGQGNYAAANACMDAWMYKYRLESSKASTVQWGAWLDMGMAAQRPNGVQHLAQKGISVQQGLAVLGSVLNRQMGSLCCAHVDWKAFLSKYAGRGPPKFFSHFSIPKAAQPPTPAVEQTQTLQWVLSVATEVIGDLEVDDPLTSAGMDSLSAVELRRKLSAAGGDGSVALPSTVAFDHPTVRALAQHVDEVKRPKDVHGHGGALPNGMTNGVAPAGLVPVVAGKACRIPGELCSMDPEAAWSQVFQAQLDVVTEIPLQRFDVNECFDPSASGVGFLTYARHASAIDGVDLFDNRFFGISSNEAAAIDPQQRHHLEIAYAACHDAGKPRKALAKQPIGVFVGQCANDWAKTSRERKAGTFMGPGTHASISANRVSFCLGLEGVSVSVDTACSSTLVALDMAIQRLPQLEAVLCSGGQLNLILEPFVSFCNGRLLSATGRCRTFDSSADGFARGEGFGAFLLVQDTMTAIAVAGSMANQDGRSSSLTAPNGPAQQRAITGAMKLAGAEAPQIAAVECHGTGTALGDPIEVGALGASLREGRDGHPLQLMAGKTNVGHLEGAAGALGLVKCIMALENLEVPPNVHLAELNPHLDLKDFLVVPSSQHSLASESSPKVGLSSFGFGGTNAHAILAAQRTAGPRPPSELSELKFNPVPFSWAQVPRLLSLHRTGKETVFEVRLDMQLAQLHPMHGSQLISSALLVAFALEGCRRHVKQAASAVQLKALKMTAPFILPSDYDGHVWLRLCINEQHFEVGSRHRYAQKAWLVHCVGRFSTQVSTRPSANLGSLSILGTPGLRRPTGPAAPRGAESFEVLCRSSAVVEDERLEDFRRKAADEGLEWSDQTFAMLSDVHVGKGELCARVKVPADFGSYTAHPELIDLLHLAALCLGFLSEGSKSLVQDLSSITSLSVPSQEIPKGTEYLVLHSRERRYGIHPESSCSSATISVDGGAVLLDLQEMHLRPVKEQQVLAASTAKPARELEVPSLYELQWSPASSGRTFQEEGGNWLLFCPGNAELAQGLARIIEKDGKASKEDDSDKESDDKKDDETEDKSSVRSEDSPHRSRRSMDEMPTATCRDTLPEEELPEFLEAFEKIFVVASGGRDRAVDVISAALQILKAQQGARSKASEIWFVVEGTQAAQLEDLAKTSIPFHAGLWGLARCARREQREQFVGCIEVGCSSGRSADPKGLWRRLRTASATQDEGREQELLVRRSALGAEESGSEDDDVERHVARLEQTASKAYGVWPPPMFPSHSWFVISGGLGGLGIATASWLMTQGVKHLALLSRSGQCQEDGPAAKELQRLCSCDIELRMEACDVASQEAVKGLVESLQNVEEIPVKGVVHAAGVLEDHLIAHMEHSHLQPVLAPKMDGAVNLHAAFSNLDHFLMFSSVAALLGSPGQGNYAAANAFLDSFAIHRQAKGLPALSLQWGPWAEVGMAARSGVGGPGFWAPKIQQADALQALGSVLAASSKMGPSVISITQVNWSVLLKRLPSMPPAWANFRNHWEPPVVPQEPDRETSLRPPEPSRFVAGGDASRTKLRTGMGMGGMGSLGLTLGLNMPFAGSLSRPSAAAAGKKDASSESPSESEEEPLAAKGL